MIVRLLLFATAREAAGCGRDDIEIEAGATLTELLVVAEQRYGGTFAAVLANSRVWVNGEEPPGREVTLNQDDEVAVLPPVSGGAG